MRTRNMAPLLFPWNWDILMQLKSIAIIDEVINVRSSQPPPSASFRYKREAKKRICIFEYFKIVEYIENCIFFWNYTGNETEIFSTEYNNRLSSSSF